MNDAPILLSQEAVASLVIYHLVFIFFSFPVSLPLHSLLLPCDCTLKVLAPKVLAYKLCFELRFLENPIKTET